MLENRDYMRQAPGPTRWSATVALIVILVIVFILQITVLSPLFTDTYLALSLEGVHRGFVWQLLTFQFMHAGWIHLLLNCWAIYVFGRELEWVLGKARFLSLYFSSGVAGGLLQMLGSWLWPSHLGGAVVGASAGAFGLVAAFTALDPERQLTMLLYFILPVRMRARTLLLLCLALTGLGIAFPHSFFGGGVAHAAHLGGMIAGVSWVKLGWHRDYVRLPWEGLLARWHQWRSSQTGRRRRELVKAASVKIPRWPGTLPDKPADLPSEEFISREVDPILDKISAHGIQSLTERERRILEAARNKMAKR
jgi:membrane associated rhomboid family serine protease